MSIIVQGCLSREAYFSLRGIKDLRLISQDQMKCFNEVAHAFYSADKDESGSLSQEEFNTILNMEGKGLASEDVWNSSCSAFA